MKIKSIILAINIFIILLLFCSCSSNKLSSSDDKQRNIELPVDTKIIYFSNSYILYSLSSIPQAESENEYQTQKIYKYNIANKKSDFLCKLDDVHTIFDDCLEVDGKVYMDMRQKGKSTLLGIDIEKNKVKKVYSRNDTTLFSHLYSIKDNIVLFSINEINGNETEHKIEKINMTSLIPQTIATTKSTIAPPSGISISTIDVNSDNIYAYTTDYTKKDNTSYIIQYNLDGGVVNKYAINMKNFLNPKNAVINGDSDTVTSLYVDNKNFTLNTMNGRVLIMKLEGTKMRRLDIPKDLYYEYPSMFHYLDYSGPESSLNYFVSNASNKDNLFIYDYKKDEFSTHTLPNDSESLYNYYRNAIGDILVAKYHSENDSAQYTIIPKDNQL